VDLAGATVSRHVPRRPGDPPRSEFTPLPFHGWFGCRGCGAVVYDWGLHGCHDHEDQAGELPEGVADLAARARAEGAAVAEFSRPRMFGAQAWRQVAACLRLRPPKDPRPAAMPGSPPTTAGRASSLLDWTREA
jgi:hypothetical protein